MTVRELIRARRFAQATALRDAAEWVDLLGEAEIRPMVVARMLRARAERIEAGEESHVTLNRGTVAPRG